MLEIKPITAGNRPDAARLCLAGASLSDRPKGFTREVEVDCTRAKLSFLQERQFDGAKAWAAYRAGSLVGYLEVHPVEIALYPVDGKGSHVIHCLRVPEVGERVEVEAALIEHAVAELPSSVGLAAVAREKDWTSLGFEALDRGAAEIQGEERVLWFRRINEGKAPRNVPVDRLIPRIQGKVRVDLFTSERCPWDGFAFQLVRGVCEQMKGTVVLYETECNDHRAIKRTGVVAGIAVNGRFMPWVRPYRLPAEHEVRRVLEDGL